MSVNGYIPPSSLPDQFERASRVDDDLLCRGIRALDGHLGAHELSSADRDRVEAAVARAIRERGGRFESGGVLYKSAGNRISRTLPT